MGPLVWDPSLIPFMSLYSIYFLSAVPKSCFYWLGVWDEGRTFRIFKGCSKLGICLQIPKIGADSSRSLGWAYRGLRGNLQKRPEQGTCLRPSPSCSAAAAPEQGEGKREGWSSCFICHWVWREASGVGKGQVRNAMAMGASC